MTCKPLKSQAEREARWSVCMAVVMTGVGMAMTIYGLAIMAGLIAKWLASPF